MKRRLIFKVTYLMLFLLLFLGLRFDSHAAETTRLQKPSNVEASLTKASNIKITWDKVDGADGYYVSRSTSPKGTFKRIKETTSLSYIDKSVSSGKAYYYKVRAFSNTDTVKNSYLSATAAYYMKPGKPNISAKYDSGKIKVTWKKVSGADKYEIYRKEASGTYQKIATTKNRYYNDKNIIEPHRYYYKVRALYVADGKTIRGAFSNIEKLFASRVDPGEKMVALTFDDGPYIYTKEIIECLEKYDGAATFFMVGDRVQYYGDIMELAADSNSEIANHSYSHATLTSLKKDGIRSEIQKADKEFKKYTGFNTALLRTPGGSLNDNISDVCGKPVIYWSIDTLDWKTRDASETYDAVMDSVKDGSIVLMHDLYSATKDAALELIPDLIEEGYQLVTVSELAACRGYELENGTMYYSFPMQKPSIRQVHLTRESGRSLAKITWNSIPGARYQLFYKTADGKDKYVKTVRAYGPTTSSTIEDLDKNTTYSFKIRQVAYGGDQKSYSEKSLAVTAKTVTYNVPKLLGLFKYSTDSGLTARISWASNPGDSYEILRKKGNGSYQVIGKLTAKSTIAKYYDNTISPDADYSYTVRKYTVKGKIIRSGGYSNKPLKTN